MNDFDRHYRIMTLSIMGLIACMGALNIVLMILILSTVQPQDKPMPSPSAPACCTTHQGDRA